jgi:hypothetical protein
MRFLNALKIPVMMLMTVGGVWAAAWQSSLPDLSRRRVVLPATHSMEKLVAKVRAENMQPDDAALDTASLVP